MKNIYLLIVVLLIAKLGVSQATSVPTIQQMYDFAVGDTFEYNTTNSYGDLYYSMVAYFYRKDYGDDSIVYKYNFFEFDTYTSSSGGSTSMATYSSSTTFLDSVFYYTQNTLDTIDTISVLIISGDTIYKVTDHYSIDFCYEGQDGDMVITTLKEWEEYQVGFGEIYSFGSTDCYNGYKELIYYHKANGEQWGTPYDFATGTNELTKNNEIRIFPNPVAGNFRLQFSEQPVVNTYLQIFDGVGRMVKEEEIHSMTTTINRASLSNGIYFWQVVSANQILQRGKIILQ